MSDQQQQVEVEEQLPEVSIDQNTLARSISNLSLDASSGTAESINGYQDIEVAQKSNAKQRSRVGGFCGCYSGRYKWFYIIITVLIILLVITALGFLTIWQLVPYMFQRAFATPQTGPYPPCVFSDFTENGFTLKVNTSLGFTNYVWTEIHFKTPITFRYLGSQARGGNITGHDGMEGILVAKMPFPDVAFGRTAYQLDTILDSQLQNTTLFAHLWKVWIAHSNYIKTPEKFVNAPEEVKADTWWLLQTNVSVKMAGLYWDHITLSRRQIWNGGLDQSGKYVEVNVTGTSLAGSPVNPQLKLDLSYTNFGVMGVNLSSLAFSLYTLYRSPLRERTLPVRIMDSKWNNFFYKPGNHNISAQNYLNINKVPYTLRAATQLATNFATNRSMILVLNHFRTYKQSNVSTQDLSNLKPSGEDGVGWLNEALSSVSFVVTVQRRKTLLGTLFSYVSRNNKSSPDLMTTINQVTDVSKTNSSLLNDEDVVVAKVPTETIIQSGDLMGLNGVNVDGFTVDEKVALLSLFQT
ncbi:hypothetical protein MP228_005346 [Amoeboaphelidium protococcarum]|nr:hypothetical protein MP228_005346 [Amoeboaphelidium protococcarum]